MGGREIQNVDSQDIQVLHSSKKSITNRCRSSVDP